MRIEIANLEGVKDFTHSYAPGELLLEDDRLRAVNPPTISGKIRREGSRAHVKGRVTGGVQVECDRCLTLIEFPVDSTFRLEYLTPEDYQAQQVVELTEDDLDLSVFDGEAIDIDELVTEELLLVLPDHVLCKDDCQGICPVCGADRNTVECSCGRVETDPRWAGLKELVNGK
jgi:uncharacterized protein